MIVSTVAAQRRALFILALTLILGVSGYITGAWAAERGVKTLALQAVANNTAAIPLYTRIGFVPVATNRFWEK